ncbi:MAG: glycosyltransferase family 2 protein [Caldilineaceae bacterium]|nr:glycosyltransferase family 2 protein [Caldilineaceae bacterium]
MTIPISAIVITKNEEEMLPGCLSALSWADEVLVVDSYSTDRTVDIARAHDARVIQHPFQDFAAQRNFAQAEATYDWVLFIDADEVVSPTLQQSIRSLADADALGDYNGYWLGRVELFTGRWWPEPESTLLPHGAAAVPFNSSVGTVRLFNRRLGNWTRALHEIVQVPQPTARLSGPLYHYSQSNLSLTFAPLAFTYIEAAHLAQIRGNRRATILEAILRAARHGVYAYFRFGWWRLGEHGLALTAISAYGKFLTYAVLWERQRIQNRDGEWLERDLKLLNTPPI